MLFIEIDDKYVIHFELVDNHYIDFKYQDIKFSFDRSDIKAFLRSNQRTKNRETIIRFDLSNDLADIKDLYS